MLESPLLDNTRDIVHIVGIPGIIGAILWFIRKGDKNAQKLEDIDKNSKDAFTTAAVIKAQVDTLATNHMAHMQKELEGQTIILRNMNENIAVIVDRTPRAK